MAYLPFQSGGIRTGGSKVIGLQLEAHHIAAILYVASEEVFEVKMVRTSYHYAEFYGVARTSCAAEGEIRCFFCL